MLAAMLNLVFRIWLWMLSWFVRPVAVKLDRSEDDNLCSYETRYARSLNTYTDRVVEQPADNVQSLMEDAMQTSLPHDITFPESKLKHTALYSPTLVFSPGHHYTNASLHSPYSSPLSGTSVPVTPIIDEEVLIRAGVNMPPQIVTPNVHDDSNASWNMSALEGGMIGLGVEMERDSDVPLFGSSGSLLGKLNRVNLSTPLPSFGSKLSRYLHASTPNRFRSNGGLLPQSIHDVGVPQSRSFWQMNDISILATPGTSPSRLDTNPCTREPDQSFSTCEPDRRHARILDSSACEAILPLAPFLGTSSITQPARLKPMISPSPSAAYLGKPSVGVPTTPFNSPEKAEKARFGPSLVPTAQSPSAPRTTVHRNVGMRMDIDALTRLLEDPTKMHRPVNTGLRPLILPRVAAKRHSLDITEIGIASLRKASVGPRPLLLPQQLANRPPSTRSNALTATPQGPTTLSKISKTALRRSMSLHDILIPVPPIPVETQEATPRKTTGHRNTHLMDEILTILNRSRASSSSFNYNHSTEESIDITEIRTAVSHSPLGSDEPSRYLDIVSLLEQTTVKGDGSISDVFGDDSGWEENFVGVYAV
ncbi:hypothetical protein K474DRAFT_1663317 [Panus rudis PR-1116 ss-1]|nr:hypothetical protein K474DRAFT_1663317 [Panus rudis PR-1116 ss-1]